MSKTDIYIFEVPTSNGHDFEEKLTPSEKVLYEGFTSVKRKREFLFGRLLLRNVLELRYGIIDPKIEFSVRGKPKIKGINFNISHSNDWLVIAFNAQHLVGIDIERSKPKKHFQTIAKSYFSLGECEYIAKGKSPEQKYNRFRILWTLKESFFKATDLAITTDTLGIHFNLLKRRIEEKPIDKNLKFTYWPKFNLSLCVVGETDSSQINFYKTSITRLGAVFISLKAQGATGIELGSA